MRLERGRERPSNATYCAARPTTSPARVCERLATSTSTSHSTTSSSRSDRYHAEKQQALRQVRAGVHDEAVRAFDAGSWADVIAAVEQTLKREEAHAPSP